MNIKETNSYHTIFVCTRYWFVRKYYVHLHKIYARVSVTLQFNKTHKYMAIHPLWTDDYWLLIMQLYQKTPIGVKSEYSRPVIELALELHIPPKTLQEQMQALDSHATPSLQRLWDTYANNPRRLTRDVKRLRQMAGFGNGDAFYKDMDMRQPFEHDYLPITPGEKLTPVMLTIILSLYFQLMTNTMVAETPEVQEMAHLMGLKPEEIVEVLKIYQTFDPILKRNPLPHSPLNDEAQRIWQRYNNETPEELTTIVEKLKEFFKGCA